MKRRKETREGRNFKRERDDHESNASNAIDNQCYRHRGDFGGSFHLPHSCPVPGPPDTHGAGSVRLKVVAVSRDGGVRCSCPSLR